MSSGSRAASVDHAGAVLALQWLVAVSAIAFALLVLFAVASSYFMLIHAHARSVLPDHLMGRGLTLQNLAVMLGVFVVQAICGVIVGAFEPVGGQPPEIAYRAVFAFLALLVTAGLFAYRRIEDVSPREETEG